jgi:hypothetical protein
MLYITTQAMKCTSAAAYKAFCTIGTASLRKINARVAVVTTVNNGFGTGIETVVTASTFFTKQHIIG